MIRLQAWTLTPALLLALALAPALGCDGGEAKPDDKSAEAKKDGAEAKKDEAEGKKDEAEAKTEEAPKVATVEAGGTAAIEVDASGYHPEEIQAPPKSKVTLAFTRTTKSGCGGELVIKAMELKKELPVGETVEIEVEVPESGELGFACGMDMYQGKVVPKA